MTQRKTVCANCKYWGGYREKVLKEKPWPFSFPKYQTKRLCKRYPPAVIKDRNDTDWPLTGFYWYCGEFDK